MSTRLTDVASRVPFSWEDRQPWLELDFPVAEFEARLGRIQAAMAADGLDALLVYSGQSSESNVRYVSGFASFWGDSLVVVPGQGRTDPRDERDLPRRADALQHPDAPGSRTCGRC